MVIVEHCDLRSRWAQSFLVRAAVEISHGYPQRNCAMPNTVLLKRPGQDSVPGPAPQSADRAHANKRHLVGTRVRLVHAFNPLTMGRLLVGKRSGGGIKRCSREPPAAPPEADAERMRDGARARREAKVTAAKRCERCSREALPRAGRARSEIDFRGVAIERGHYRIEIAGQVRWQHEAAVEPAESMIGLRMDDPCQRDADPYPGRGSPRMAPEIKRGRQPEWIAGRAESKAGAISRRRRACDHFEGPAARSECGFDFPVKDWKDLGPTRGKAVCEQLQRSILGDNRSFRVPRFPIGYS